ncbi:hypothetical protein EDC96DRAFT_581382 [Choanephora cucurbitarum]|nr:hypothetical protein EDC96DRAFT_581382 [Choanephora cucurbitarum]
MESIISVFFGVCFPHAVESAEEEGVEKFYMPVYEPHRARYFIKAVGDIDLLKKAVTAYDSEWSLEAFLNSKSPLMIAISGAMIQQEIGQSFLGPVLEEKFHVRCSSMTILPCLPLVPEALRDRLHPDVSPNQIQEGIKNGYFLTNLSMNQVFAVPEFREVEQEDEQEDDHLSEDGHNVLHSDRDEIESNSSGDDDDEEREDAYHSSNGSHSQPSNDVDDNPFDNADSWNENNFLSGSELPVLPDDSESFTNEARSRMQRYNSDMSLCSDGHAADASSSLDSDLYRSLVTTNLLDSSNLHKQGSVDSFGEGPSYSRPVTLPLPSSSPAEIQNALVTQIGQMRRELPESLYLSRKGKEPMRSTSNVAAVRCRSNSENIEQSLLFNEDVLESEVVV